MSTERILQDQIDYYRARSGEYDQWWFRAGRYDRGPELNARWRADVAAVEHALVDWIDAKKPRNALELACGTGLFTRHIAPRVAHLTAVDASPEVLAINRSRVAAPSVEYIQADLFAWRQPQHYDAVFFTFWLSHVPQGKFAAFWRMVSSALAPGGAAYLIDSAFDPTSGAKDHVVPGKDAEIATRRLNDGREFSIVKLFYTPETLAARLAAAGFASEIRQTAQYFIYGWAQPSPAA
jgi:demethylmenaquinone methyltransferase/2-methoxy-6-polyprenyl-1,4-benzoquinol methylase